MHHQIMHRGIFLNRVNMMEESCDRSIYLLSATDSHAVSSIELCVARDRWLFRCMIMKTRSLNRIKFSLFALTQPDVWALHFQLPALVIQLNWWARNQWKFVQFQVDIFKQNSLHPAGSVNRQQRTCVKGVCGVQQMSFMNEQCVLVSFPRKQTAKESEKWVCSAFQKGNETLDVHLKKWLTKSSLPCFVMFSSLVLCCSALGLCHSSCLFCFEFHCVYSLLVQGNLFITREWSSFSEWSNETQRSLFTLEVRIDDVWRAKTKERNESNFVIAIPSIWRWAAFYRRTEQKENKQQRTFDKNKFGSIASPSVRIPGRPHFLSILWLQHVSTARCGPDKNNLKQKTLLLSDHWVELIGSERLHTSNLLVAERKNRPLTCRQFVSRFIMTHGKSFTFLPWRTGKGIHCRNLSAQSAIPGVNALCVHLENLLFAYSSETEDAQLSGLQVVFICAQKHETTFLWTEQESNMDWC